MRLKGILLLGGMLAPAPAVQAVPAAPAAVTADADGEDELDLAVQMTAQAYREQLEILRTMQDAVSAANAEPRLRACLRMRYKLYGLCAGREGYCARCDEAVRADALACAQELRRLEEAAFFGVQPVRGLFVDPAPGVRACVGDTLRAVSSFPADDLEEVAERFRMDMAQYQQQNAWLVGGPGFSRESAWVITVGEDVTERERHFLRTVLHSAPCGQSLHESDGRVYDCLYAVYTVNGEPFRLEQWFDVTLCHKVGSLRDAEDELAEDAEPEPEPAAPVGDAALAAGNPVDEGDDDDVVAEDPDLDAE